MKGIFELNNGGGLFGKFNKTVWLLTSLLTYLNEAREFDSKACKAIWDFEGKSIVPYQPTSRTYVIISPLGIYATSRHIPGVRFAGVPHPGLMYVVAGLLYLLVISPTAGLLLHKSC